MRTVSPSLGKKFSAGRLKRHREGVERAIAAGRMFGAPRDPRTRIERRSCQLPTCGIEFDFTVRPKTDARAGRYCKQKHSLLHTAMLRMKVPGDYDLLYDLYVTKKMSTPEIAEIFDTTHGAVGHRLKYLGIVARKAGHSRNVVCNQPGCGLAVFKLRHPINGSMYGTKCEAHYWQHRKGLYASRYGRIKEARGNIPDKILEELNTGTTTSRKIAQKLKVPVKVVSTSMGHLARRGEIECFGSVLMGRAKQKLWRVIQQTEAIAC